MRTFMMKASCRFFLFVVVTICGWAQSSTSLLDGTTPPGIAPGAPVGSFPLTDLESVNL